MKKPHQSRRTVGSYDWIMTHLGADFKPVRTSPDDPWAGASGSLTISRPSATREPEQAKPQVTGLQSAA